MKTNRERAEALFYTWEYDKPLDDIIVTIEAALDEAERRGHQEALTVRIDSPTKGKGVVVYKSVDAAFLALSELNTILDKVIEMDRCQGRSSRDGCFKGRLTNNIGECRRCDGTGLGPIARYIKEVRGG